MRELADARRLPGAVHADNQDHGRLRHLFSLSIRVPDAAAAGVHLEDRRQLVLQRIQRLLRLPDAFALHAVLDVIQDAECRLDASVRRDQRFFELVPELIVQPLAEHSADAAEEALPRALDRPADGDGSLGGVFYRFARFGVLHRLGYGRCGGGVAGLVRLLRLVAFFPASQESCHRFDDRRLAGRGSIALERATEQKVLPNGFRWVRSPGLTGLRVAPQILGESLRPEFAGPFGKQGHLRRDG